MLTPHEDLQRKGLSFGICVIIFRHVAAFYKFSHFWDEYIYYINDERLTDTEQRCSLETYVEIFTATIAKKTDKSIFVIDYTPEIALYLQVFIKSLERAGMSFPTRFICLSFFHDDETTSNIIADFDDNTSSEDYVMDEKFKIIESMTHFPFIKKYEIPIGYTIGKSYLANLIKDLL